MSTPLDTSSLPHETWHMTTYTAKVERSGDRCAVAVPQVSGLFTQGRNLVEEKDKLRRALELYPEIETDPDTAEVVIQMDTPRGEEAATAIARNRALVVEKEAAAAAMVRAARHLVDRGLAYCDTAVLLGISHQRVAQLICG